MEKLTAKQELIMLSLLKGMTWEAIQKEYKLSCKSLDQLRYNRIFLNELRKKQDILLAETSSRHHIYTKDSLETLHILTKTARNERTKVEAAKTLLKAVQENIDMLATLHTRYEIDDIKQQLSLDLAETNEEIKSP